jgi:hypothetical protein
VSLARSTVDVTSIVEEVERALVASAAAGGGRLGTMCIAWALRAARRDHHLP